MCLSVSAFKSLSAHGTHKHLHITGTLVYFDSVQTVYDYRLLSQYLDFAGKGKTQAVYVSPATVCGVWWVWTVCRPTCVCSCIKDKMR